VASSFSLLGNQSSCSSRPWWTLLDSFKQVSTTSPEEDNGVVFAGCWPNILWTKTIVKWL
jgi:hypothetical protein